MTKYDKPRLVKIRPGDRGLTYLHYACYCGDIEMMMNTLVDGVNRKDSYRGYAALHWLTDMAAAQGPRLEMLEILLGEGADPRLMSDNGLTPSDLAKQAGSKMGDELHRNIEEWILRNPANQSPQ